MKKRLTSGFVVSFWILVITALVAACLGDVEIADQPPPGPLGSPPNTATDPLTPVCDLGAVRCNGQWLERCDLVANSAATEWSRAQDCLTPALCKQDPGRCLPPACSFGDLRCDGAIAERCSEDLTERLPVDTCVNAAHCSLEESECSAESQHAPCCLSAPCEAGALRCNGAEMQRCRDDRTDRDPVVSCATPALCTASLAGCQSKFESCSCVLPTCDAGATRCTGTTLERCNADQTAWEFVETCATAALCESGRQLQQQQKQPLACQAQACEVGQHRCTGAKLEVCNPDQTGFDSVQDCLGGSAFCDPVGGSCTQVPCSVGETRCNGAQIERCRDDQSAFTAVAGSVCATPQLCGPGPNGAAACRAPACAANAFTCTGNQLQKCNAGQTDFANFGPTCLRADLCSAARQRCDFCFPSRRECTPDLSSSRTCNSDGNSFGPLTFCPLGCVAATGACQTCNVGQYSCQNGLLSRCNDGFSFSPLNRAADCSGSSRVSCSGNSVQTSPCGSLGCNTSRNACNECAATQQRCADTQRFQSCRPDGTFGPAQSCGDGLLCAGAGQCACTPGQPSCSGDTLVVCNPNGSGLVAGARCSGTGGNVLRTCSAGDLTTNTCASAALCGAATGADCPGCVEGERTCSSTTGQPLVCSGGQRVPATACDPGFACEGAGTCRCASGTLRCTGTQLQICGATRQTFDAAPACSGSTLRFCSAGTVGSSDCGLPELCAASSGSSCASCLATDPPGCADDVTQTSCVQGQPAPSPCADGETCVAGVGCQAAASN